LLGLLDQFDTEYVRNPEPKTQLLASLAMFPSEDVRTAVEPFLEDASESVRFSAVSTVFAMSSPQSVVSLVTALEQEESLRVKNRIAQGLAERQWQIAPEQHSICESKLPPGFRLVGDLIRADA
jgi:HEAT repeat protein